MVDLKKTTIALSATPRATEHNMSTIDKLGVNK
jgi:hypothetical protein